jgi:hypothetical protein
MYPKCLFCMAFVLLTQTTLNHPVYPKHPPCRRFLDKPGGVADRLSVLGRSVLLDLQRSLGTIPSILISIRILAHPPDVNRK